MEATAYEPPTQPRFRVLRDEDRAEYDAGDPAPARPGTPFMTLSDEEFSRALALGSAAFTLYAYLAKRSNQAGECWPSYQTTSDETGMSRRVVILWLKKLETAGLIAITKRQKPTGDATSNLFTLPLRKVREVVTEVVQNRNHVVQKSNQGGYESSPKLDTVELDTENRTLSPPLVPPPKKQARPTTSQRTQVDHDYQPMEQQYQWAQEKHGLDRARVDVETEQWINHHEERGTLIASMDASWRKWMGNVNKFGPVRGGVARPTKEDAARAKMLEALGR